MEIVLDDKQRQEIQGLIIQAVNQGVEQATNTRPYLTRKEIAQYFGVAESTITHWARLGMPVAVVDGRKLYGKQSITKWLESKEQKKAFNYCN